MPLSQGKLVLVYQNSVVNFMHVENQCDQFMSQSSFLVIGAGSWGTALALLLARNGHSVALWSREANHRDAMRQDRCNQKFLPNHRFPDNIEIIDDFVSATQDHILIAVPSQGFRQILAQLSSPQGIVWATKGLDHDSGQLLSEVATEILGDHIQLAILTGPSFAKEVADQHPSAVVLAANNQAYGKRLQACFHSPYFRTYLSDDLIGAQLGGAIKNVMAIAVGIADGLQYGSNTTALLITRGLAEILRLGQAVGAKQETLVGLSGLGDLVLTCSDNQSRNRQFGYLLGQGFSQREAKAKVKQVVEGVHATELVYHWTQKLGIEAPITEQMYQLLYQGQSPQDAVNDLLARKIKSEF